MFVTQGWGYDSMEPGERIHYQMRNNKFLDSYKKHEEKLGFDNGPCINLGGCVQMVDIKGENQVSRKNCRRFWDCIDKQLVEQRTTYIRKAKQDLQQTVTWTDKVKKEWDANVKTAKNLKNDPKPYFIANIPRPVYYSG